MGSIRSILPYTFDVYLDNSHTIPADCRRFVDIGAKALKPYSSKLSMISSGEESRLTPNSMLCKTKFSAAASNVSAIDSMHVTGSG